MPDTPKYSRVLLKLSGEALMGDDAFGINPAVLQATAQGVIDVARAGVETALVIGGGNIFRGAGLAANGMDRVSGDHMGMLATVMNALAFAHELERLGQPARVLSALSMEQVCETYTRDRAVEQMAAGRVVLCAAGTGNPYFTTDSAASLRAIEIGAKLMIKATKVNGVYSADPMKDPAAERYSKLSYDEVLDKRLGVMDLTAIVLCRDNGLPLRVVDMGAANVLRNTVMGGDEGTLVE